MSLSIKARVGLTSGLLATMLCGIGILGLFGMSTNNASYRLTYAHQLPASRAIGKTQLFETRERLAVLAAFTAVGTPGMEKFIETGLALRKESDAGWKRYMDIPRSSESSILANAAQDKLYALRAAIDKVYAALRADDKNGASMAVDTLPALYTAMIDSQEALQTFLSTKAANGYNAALATYDTVRLFTTLALLLGVALAVYAWWSLRAAIGRPLAEALMHFDAISAGDLRTQVKIRSNDEMGHLMQGLARMQASLIDTVSTVRTGSESIATATQQIAAGNIDLSSRTEEQASALQETAASMEQLTGTVKQNADNARQASTLAATASSIAQQGSQVVSEVVSTMGEINQSSSKIADIIAIIEGIAFQTNILALNAAVEAARAGEEGRGFAVVAGEVRNLAQRSSSAAKEIKGLIDVSVERVQSGSTLVDDAGKTMTEIIAAVQRVTDIMGEIAAASGEQSNGIDQVARAVSQMDEATQQNAALVEEAAAAAQSLEDQTRTLREAVAVFQIEGHTTRERAASTQRSIEASSKALQWQAA